MLGLNGKAAAKGARQVASPAQDRTGRPARLTGWGRGPALDTHLVQPSRPDEVARWVGQGGVIARGGGCGYGDCAVGPSLTIDLTRCDRFLGLDPQTLVLSAEAGVRLHDLIPVALAHGAFPPVVPGTGRVTLGGMIAADVHGKNHHRAGSLRGHIAWIDLMGPDGMTHRLAPGSGLFDRTVGGMGLTGVILRAGMRLMPMATGWLRQEVRVADDLAALLAALAAAERHDHAVAWLDARATGAGVGRGLVLAADHLSTSSLPERCRDDPRALRMGRRWRIPGWLPPLPTAAWRLQGRLNALRFAQGRRRAAAPSILPWHRFFFPLDSVAGWTRLFGAAGMVQLQVCFPRENAETAILGLLERARAHDLRPTLAVVKNLGPSGGSEGIGFPGGGVSLAMDMPRSSRLASAAPDLIAQCLSAGGRFYLAKDSLLDAAAFRSSDPRASAFAAWRRDSGLAGAFASAQSQRLGL